MGTNESATKNHVPRNATQKKCFIVYSTRDSHVSKVIDRLTDLLSNELSFAPIKLDEARIPGTPLLPDILQYSKECDVGIVILDGLRPNVLLELGMLLGNGTPCVVLLEKDAQINVASLITDTGRQARSAPQIKIDISKHISDISNLSWNRYSIADDTGFRITVREAVKKLIPQIKSNRGDDHENFSSKVRQILRKIDSSSDMAPEKHANLINKAHQEMLSFSKDQASHICFHIVRSLTQRKELQSALKEAIVGIKLDPNYAQLYEMKGEILCMLGQHKDGIKELKSAHIKYPQNKSLLRTYLDALNADGNPKEVLKRLSRLPYESLLIDDLIPIKARALLLDNQFQAGLKLLLDMYEYDSNEWAIHSVMSLLKEHSHEILSKGLIGKIQKNVVRAIMKNHISCRTCIIGGCKTAGLTQVSNAFVHKNFNNKKPRTANALNEFAFDFISVGDYKMASDILNKSLKRWPSHSYLNATCGMYHLIAKKNIKLGKKHYLKSIEIRPSDMPLRQMYFYQLGNFFKQAGNRLEATNCYQQALAVQTDAMRDEVQTEFNALRKARSTP